MGTDSFSVREVFKRYANPDTASEAGRVVVSHLVNDSLSKANFDEVCSNFGVKHSLAFKLELLDLFLFYVRTCLENHPLTAEEMQNAQHLKLLFHIREGNLHTSKFEDIRKIFASEVCKILADRVVDQAEALRQVDLQRAFDLSYDQFLEIVREPLDKIVNDLIDQITTDGIVMPEEQQELHKQILALDSVYKLNHAQKKRLMAARKGDREV